LLAVIHELVFLRGYKLRLRLAGDGPLFAQAKEQVCRDGLTSVVEFLGVLDNKQTCQEIAHAHLYMQLSYDQMIKVPGGAYIHAEGMGRSILEALTAGTFVVAGRSGALSEIVTAGRGILLELNNIKQIVNQLEPVLQNIPVPLPLLDDFSWTKIFKGYETVFRNINENIVNHGKMHCK
jgi:glycosyltransferase involved in cell wall biosynthesis